MTNKTKVALLVGAGDAIGAAVAQRFARGGYTVCVARREAAKSQGLVDSMKADGHDVRAYSVDARKEEDVQKLFADVEKDVGPVEDFREMVLLVQAVETVDQRREGVSLAGSAGAAAGRSMPC